MVGGQVDFGALLVPVAFGEAVLGQTLADGLALRAHSHRLVVGAGAGQFSLLTQEVVVSQV